MIKSAKLNYEHQLRGCSDTSSPRLRPWKRPRVDGSIDAELSLVLYEF